ncbi:MAG: hypothetical protein ABL883_05025 [Terricaulis sp.]
MLRRMTFVSALLVLAACAGVEPIGRGVSRAPAPPEAAAPAAAEVPPEAALAPSEAPTPPRAVAAENVTAPAAAPRRASRSGEDEIVVPGQAGRQVPPPNGDPRNIIERMEDIRAWDQCVMGEQGAFDGDPMSPRLDTPEDLCRRSLGMSDRDAVPESRVRRVR